MVHAGGFCMVVGVASYHGNSTLLKVVGDGGTRDEGANVTSGTGDNGENGEIAWLIGSLIVTGSWHCVTSVLLGSWRVDDYENGTLRGLGSRSVSENRNASCCCNESQSVESVSRTLENRNESTIVTWSENGSTRMKSVIWYGTVAAAECHGGASRILPRDLLACSSCACGSHLH